MIKKDLIIPKGYLTVKQYADSQKGYNGLPLTTQAVYSKIQKYRKLQKENIIYKIGFDIKIIGRNTFVLPH